MRSVPTAAGGARMRISVFGREVGASLAAMAIAAVAIALIRSPGSSEPSGLNVNPSIDATSPRWERLAQRGRMLRSRRGR